MQVREYACLTTDAAINSSLDVGSISSSTFNWLIEVSNQPGKNKRFLSMESPTALKLGSFVGYLESPTGEVIEVLPKTGLGAGDSSQSRLLLQRMLRVALNLKPQQYGAADLLRMDVPLHEWIVAQFLAELKILVRRGLRFEYQEVEEESTFIRGRLNMVAQLRQAPGRANRFHICHDDFSPQRVENRLLKSALVIAQKVAKAPDNWRLANELAHQMEVIDPAQDPSRELRQWRSSKLMRSYDAIRPWCELILERLNPNFQKGQHRGIALLFPMEYLFEKYVATCLRETVRPYWELKTQAKTQYLLKHTAVSGKSRQLFNMQPDLILRQASISIVMDTKWKLIDAKSPGDGKYGIDQDDLYQMFAYGHKYQKGVGELVLIYPKHEQFTSGLPPFFYDEELRLWVVPFCLESGMLLEGDWSDQVPAFIQ